MTDSFYTIGSSHDVCQDFAVSEPGFVAVSDGCSTGGMTCVGARLLVQMSRSWDIDPVYGVHPFAARNLAKNLNLTCQDFAATLLSLKIDYNGSLSFMRFGDGAIFHKLKTGNLIIDIYDFEQNAPYYLAYKFFGQEKIWRGQFPNNPCRMERHTFDGDLKPVSVIEYGVVGNYEHGAFPVPQNELEYVGVSSDGLTTFVDEDNTALPLAKIVPHLFGFKNYNERFMKRRNKMMVKEGLKHYDDLSMAIITFKEMS